MVVPSSWDNSKEEKNRIEPVISMIKKWGNLDYGILCTWLCDISYVASNSKLFWVIWLEVAVGDIFNEFNDVDDESATKIVSYICHQNIS